MEEEKDKKISTLWGIILIIAIFITAINIILLIQNFSNIGKSYLEYVCNNTMNTIVICLQVLNIILIMLGFSKYISNKNKQFKIVFTFVIVILIVTFFMPVKHSTIYKHNRNTNNNSNQNDSINNASQVLTAFSGETTTFTTTSKNLYSITIWKTKTTMPGTIYVD